MPGVGYTIVLRLADNTCVYSTFRFLFSFSFFLLKRKTENTSAHSYSRELPPTVSVEPTGVVPWHAVGWTAKRAFLMAQLFRCVSQLVAGQLVASAAAARQWMAIDAIAKQLPVPRRALLAVGAARSHESRVHRAPRACPPPPAWPVGVHQCFAAHVEHENVYAVWTVRRGRHVHSCGASSSLQVVSR